MGCTGRAKGEVRPEQKWEFISLQDFKSTSCVEPFAYVYLWISLAISVAVYGVDTFTAVNLLAFSKFTSIQPAISLNVSKWIFSVCIILSWINLGYEHWRAYGVIRRGAVAESYLDSLAVRLQAIRMGKTGQGWRRFLVFAELTKSKKGAEYVALFTYFAFQSWIRVIFCSGPRQVVNALTLYAVYQAQLNPNDTDAATSIFKFFSNIEVLAKEDYRQALILAGMLFTLVIWVFAVLSLILAILFYILFLWHYIPNSDRGLSAYCERKINGRLNKIVSAKVQKALEEEERQHRKAEQKAVKKGEKPITRPQPTVPSMLEGQDDDRLPGMPMINRNDTMATLPKYTSRPGTPSSQQPTLPDVELSNLDQKRPFPSRPATSGSSKSNFSYASNAPLVGAAAEMGYDRNESPAPSVPAFDPNGFPFPQRSMTGSSAANQWPRGGPQPPRNGPLSRQTTQDSFANVLSPPSRNQDGYPIGPSRQMTQDSFANGRTSPPYPAGPSRQMTQDSSANGRTSPPLRNQDGYPAGPSRQMTKESFVEGSTKLPLRNDGRPAGPSRQNTQDSFANGRTSPSSLNEDGYNAGSSRQMTKEPFANRRTSPPSGSQDSHSEGPSKQVNQDSFPSDSTNPEPRALDGYPARPLRQMTEDSITPNSRDPLSHDKEFFPFGPSTQDSHGSSSRGTPSRNPDNFPPPSRQMTQDSYSSSSRGAPSRNPGDFPPPSRQMTQESYFSSSRGVPSRNPDDFPPPSRQMTQDSYSSSSRPPPTRNEDDFPLGASRKWTQDSYAPGSRGPPPRQMTQDEFVTSPISYKDSGRNSPHPQPSSPDNYGRPLYLPNGSLERRPPFGDLSPSGRASPSVNSYTGSQPGRGTPGPGPRSNMSLNDPSSPARYGPPPRSTSAGIGPGASFQRQPPSRNMTEPAPMRAPTEEYSNVQPRQAMPQSQTGYQEQYTGYGGPESDGRSRRGPPSRGYPQQGPPGGYRG